MDWWKGMSRIVLISFIYWWNGISSVILISFIYMLLSFILEKLDRLKGNNNWSNSSNLHQSDILPQSEISNRFEFTHVNKLLVITVFRNFCRVVYNVREKLSAEWASFWINFWKKRMFLLKHSCLCFLYLNTSELCEYMQGMNIKANILFFVKNAKVKTTNQDYHYNKQHQMKPKQLHI